MAYTPKYVSLSDVPVQIPDDYSQQQKEDALQSAEASLELDLNDGDEIPSNEVVPSMVTAVKHKATCHLAQGAESPDDVTLGDIDDSGTTMTEYAQAFCDHYDELVDKMLDADILADEGGESTSPYTYSTEKPEDDDNYNEYYDSYHTSTH